MQDADQDLDLGTQSNGRDGRAYDLHSVVVSYSDRPDRCTIYPRNTSCYERIETWLTADQAAFLDLDEMR